MSCRTVDITATRSGLHRLEFGFDEDKLASFKMQLWITKYGSRAVDWLQSLSIGFCSFMGGNLYLHNSDEVARCNLFGEQKDCKVGVVINKNPDVTKILDSIGIHSDGLWEVESITIPPTVNYPNGMYSRIPKELFRKREGVLKCEFLRNMKTTSAVANALDALRGEPLRGKEAYLILKNTSTSKVQLYKIDINMTISK